MGFRQWDGEGDFSALGLSAEMSISDGGESDGVVVDVGNETFEVLDHTHGASVDG